MIGKAATATSSITLGFVLDVIQWKYTCPLPVQDQVKTCEHKGTYFFFFAK